MKRLTALLATTIAGLAIAGPAAADVTTLPPIGQVPPPLSCMRLLTIDTVTAAEGTPHPDDIYISYTPFTFTISSTGCSRPGTVSFQTHHDTTNSQDYVSRSGTLTFTSGDMSDRFITVLVRRDSMGGMNERFSLRLTTSSDVIREPLSGGSGWIMNDDPCGTGGFPPGQYPDYHCAE
jgi:hypothetical protein